MFFVLGEGDVCSCGEYFMEWKIWRLRSWLVSLRSLNISCWNIVLKFIYDGLDIIDVSGNLKICGKLFLYFIKYFIFFFVRFIMLKMDGKARFDYVPFTLSQINAAFDQIYAVKLS